MPDIQWFDGDAPRTDAEATFLATVRAHADDWDAAGLTPACTVTLAVLVPLHLQVDLPGIPSGVVNLQVGYLETPPAGRAVVGEWGDRYLLDGGRPRFEQDGTDPCELAEVAVLWLITQLARPLEVAEWLSGAERVVGTSWSLADTGDVLARRGVAGRRWFRRPPDRVRRLR